MGLPYSILHPENLDSVAVELEKADLIVDALLEQGLRSPREPFASLIRMVNKAGNLSL